MRAGTATVKRAIEVLALEAVTRPETHINQVINIVRAVLVAGRDSEQDLTQVIAITKGKGLGVVAECKHHGTGRGKQC